MLSVSGKTLVVSGELLGIRHWFVYLMKIGRISH